MPTPFSMVLTSAGKAAALDQVELGLSLNLTQIAIGTGQYVPDGTETALQAQTGIFPLGDGDVQVSSNTLRFSATLLASVPSNAFEIGLYSSTGVLFAVASTTSSSPLVVLAPNISFIGLFGLYLADLPSDAITVSLDPNAPLAVSLLLQHMAAVDPHSQYLMKTTATLNGINANLASTNNIHGGDCNNQITAGEFWVDSSVGNRPPLEGGGFDVGVMKVAYADGTSGAFHNNVFQLFLGVYGIYGRYAISVSPSVPTPLTWSPWISTANLQDVANEASVRNTADVALSGLITSEYTRATGYEAYLLGLINANAAALPKALAVGFGTMSTSDDGSNTLGTATVSTPSGVDLTNGAKYILRWGVIGSGHDDAAATQPSFGCSWDSVSFTVTQRLNDTSIYPSKGQFTFSWTIWQVS